MAYTVREDTLDDIIKDFEEKRDKLIRSAEHFIANTDDERAIEARAVIIPYYSYQCLPVTCTVSLLDTSFILEFWYIGESTDEKECLVRLNPDTRAYTMIIKELN